LTYFIKGDGSEVDLLFNNNANTRVGSLKVHIAKLSNIEDAALAHCEGEIYRLDICNAALGINQIVFDSERQVRIILSPYCS